MTGFLVIPQQDLWMVEDLRKGPFHIIDFSSHLEGSKHISLPSPLTVEAYYSVRTCFGKKMYTEQSWVWENQKSYRKDRQNHGALCYFYMSFPPCVAEVAEHFQERCPIKRQMRRQSCPRGTGSTHSDPLSPEHTYIFWTLLWHPCLRSCCFPSLCLFLVCSHHKTLIEVQLYLHTEDCL